MNNPYVSGLIVVALGYSWVQADVLHSDQQELGTELASGWENYSVSDTHYRLHASLFSIWAGDRAAREMIMRAVIAGEFVLCTSLVEDEAWWV